MRSHRVAETGHRPPVKPRFFDRELVIFEKPMISPIMVFGVLALGVFLFH